MTVFTNASSASCGKQEAPLPTYEEMQTLAEQCGVSLRVLFDKAYALYHGAPVLELAGRPFTERRWLEWVGTKGGGASDSAPYYLTAAFEASRLMCDGYLEKHIVQWCPSRRMELLLSRHEIHTIRLFRAMVADGWEVSQRTLGEGEFCLYLHYLLYVLKGQGKRIEAPIRRLDAEEEFSRFSFLKLPR